MYPGMMKGWDTRDWCANSMHQNLRKVTGVADRAGACFIHSTFLWGTKGELCQLAHERQLTGWPLLEKRSAWDLLNEARYLWCYTYYIFNGIFIISSELSIPIWYPCLFGGLLHNSTQYFTPWHRNIYFLIFSLMVPNDRRNPSDLYCVLNWSSMLWHVLFPANNFLTEDRQ